MLRPEEDISALVSIEEGAGKKNIHETWSAFWAPPLVAAEEVLLDMAALVVRRGVVGVGARTILSLR